jgi:hypothetical protein
MKAYQPSTVYHIEALFPIGKADQWHPLGGQWDTLPKAKRNRDAYQRSHKFAKDFRVIKTTTTRDIVS